MRCGVVALGRSLIDGRDVLVLQFHLCGSGRVYDVGHASRGRNDDHRGSAGKHPCEDYLMRCGVVALGNRGEHGVIG